MSKLRNHFEKDRRYEFLTGTILAALCVPLWAGTPCALSFLGADGVLLRVLQAVCALFAALALLALAVKATHWRGYAGTFLKRPGMVKLARIFYWMVVLAFALTVTDRLALSLIDTVRGALAAEKNPDGFIASMVYMFWNSRSFFWYGIGVTVKIALLGTAIAFLLAVLVAFLRIQKPARQDDDLVRFLKKLGRGFAHVYITVIRGTPMMVQALIIYYAGFGLFKGSGMTVTEINRVWSFFISGLFTVSLNSTAYLAEVLRGGIESIDAGQTEAARSLGMTGWQAMRRVVFPQAVKNSVPAIGNEFIINIKDSSVLSVIGVMDLMYATSSVSGIYYSTLPIYCVAALLYLILTYLSSLIMKGVSHKLDTQARDLPSSN